MFAPSRQEDSECSSAGFTSSCTHYTGEVTMKERGEKTVGRGGNGVKHKERSFEKAPGLSRGRGRGGELHP